MVARTAALCLGLAFQIVLSPAWSAPPGGQYAENLAALYAEYQWVLAARDACGKTQTKQQAEIDSALGAWRERHRQVIDDLEARVAAMVRKASKDQREYTRNYARSQSEVIKQRDEERSRLLAMPGEELQRLCAEFPGYLRDARSDIQARLPEEFAAIYGKKAP
jgi:hypothetical protein